MQEENRENTTIEKTAEALGLFSALLVFSTVVYFIWNFLGRLPFGGSIYEKKYSIASK